MTGILKIYKGACVLLYIYNNSHLSDYHYYSMNNNNNNIINCHNNNYCIFSFSLVVTYGVIGPT